MSVTLYRLYKEKSINCLWTLDCTRPKSMQSFKDPFIANAYFNLQDSKMNIFHKTIDSRLLKFTSTFNQEFLILAMRGHVWSSSIEPALLHNDL